MANDELVKAVRDVAESLERCKEAIGSDGDWQGRCGDMAKRLRAALSAEKQRADDIREILSAALVSEEAFSIAPLTDTEASDLSYVLVKAIAAQGAPNEETCVWTARDEQYLFEFTTACGNTMEILPDANSVFKFCGGCGKQIVWIREGADR